jgi:hypothetical protein
MRWDQPDPRPWPTDDPIAQLVWLATSGAEAWVPTLDELRALREKRIDERRHPNGEPDQPRPDRQLLNQPPRSHYDRIADEITITARTPEEVTL